MSQTILLLYFEAMYEEPSLSSETMIISMHMLSISYSYSSSFLLYFGNRQRICAVSLPDEYVSETQQEDSPGIQFECVV
jgi:hypothetical protein